MAQALASVLRKHRLAKGFSQELLAEKAGLHTTYISMLERNVRKPTVDVADALAKALGKQLSALVAEAEGVQRRGK